MLGIKIPTYSALCKMRRRIPLWIWNSLLKLTAEFEHNSVAQQKRYSDEEYHQRSLIESGFGSLKRKYGGFVFGKSINSIRPEIYCKAIAHNLSLS